MLTLALRTQVVPPAKVDKLVGVLHKLFSKIGDVVDDGSPGNGTEMGHLLTTPSLPGKQEQGGGWLCNTSLDVTVRRGTPRGRRGRRGRRRGMTFQMLRHRGRVGIVHADTAMKAQGDEV